MKHIDADKLIAEIKFAKSVYDNPKRVIHGVADAFRQDGRAAMCDDILKKIASLQQEQPECSSSLVDVDAVREDFITEVYRVLDADPTNDRANAIINAFDSLPTVSQKQPEVDLEKEIKNYLATKCAGDDEPSVSEIAHHFYELGLNTKKEETK